MGKKILYVLIIIALIIAGVFVAKKMSEEKDVSQTVTNTLEQTNKGNEIEENNVIESDENEIENNIETGNTELAPEEQAKQIVKENWGEDDTVYYSYDGKDESGRYVICVREKSTTKAMYRYYVDVETGSFDIE